MADERLRELERQAAVDDDESEAALRVALSYVRQGITGGVVWARANHAVARTPHAWTRRLFVEGQPSAALCKVTTTWFPSCLYELETEARRAREGTTTVHGYDLSRRCTACTQRLRVIGEAAALRYWELRVAAIQEALNA